jgi:hypothetical protein
MRKILVTFVPGLIGACIGSVLGYFVFDWVSRIGGYYLVIPGALAGLGCGLFAVDHSKIRGFLCACIAFAACLYTYWKFMSPPFETDGRFLDLVMNLHKFTLISQLLIALGTFLGFWWGRESTNPWRHRFAAKADKGQESPG